MMFTKAKHKNNFVSDRFCVFDANKMVDDANHNNVKSTSLLIVNVGCKHEVTRVCDNVISIQSTVTLCA